MPTIPTAKRTVQLRATPGVQRRQTTQPIPSAEAFGAGIGKAITGVADVAAGHVLDELATQNQTRALEIDNEFRDALGTMQYDPEKGYYNKRGRDAFEQNDQFNQTAEELYKLHLGKAENASQQMMLAKTLRLRTNQVKTGAQRYAQKEYQTWQDNAAKASIASDTSEAVTNFDNPEYVELMRTSGESKLRELGRSQGLDGEQINATLKVFNSGISVGIVERLITEDVTAAREQYNQYVKDKEIVGTDQTALLRKLKIAEKGSLATDRADYSELTNMAMRDPEAFIKLDLNKYELSDEDFKYFEKDQRNAQFKKDKHDEKYTGIKRAMSLASSQLKSAGIVTGKKVTKKKAKQIAEFEGALLQSLQRFKAETGKAPNETEQLSIIRDLLRTGEVQGSGIFFDDEAFLFENKEGTVIGIEDIDEVVQETIRSRYREIYKREPTEEEISQTYTNFIQNRTRGAK